MKVENSKCNCKSSQDFELLMINLYLNNGDLSEQPLLPIRVTVFGCIRQLFLNYDDGCVIMDFNGIQSCSKRFTINRPTLETVQFSFLFGYLFE